MELQHTNTFRVTMTRSHRKDSTNTHTSIRTNNTFDANVAVNTEVHAEREACVQLKKQIPTKAYGVDDTRAERRPNNTTSPAAKLVEHNP